uniref:STAS domain-containing protein n=1 Tax=Rhabditophanes sp. KR3021 TaxID=114890 RepID=A0AC35U018_9BILA
MRKANKYNSMAQNWQHISTPVTNRKKSYMNGGGNSNGYTEASGMFSGEDTETEDTMAYLKGKTEGHEFITQTELIYKVFAVVSMMVGATKLRIINEDKIFINVNGTDILQHQIDDASLLSTITLTVGLIQFTIGLLKLGFLTNYMSDSLLSGFTTGAACHVFVSQINKVLGYKVPGNADTGVGILIFMLKEILIRINQTNLMTLGMSFISILVLSLGRDYLNPWVKKFTKIPVPLELILVVVSTAASMFFNLKSTFNVPVVNHIPQGFPIPKLLPDFKLIPRIFTDCLGIAVVCYMFVISMGKLFAKKHKYKIDATQELYACGLMSMLSCFFNVYPTGASLSRSSVCEMSGVKTQLNVIFSSSLLFVVIMWLGKYLEPLPMCILASIVIVSLKSLFMQFQELPRLWRISKYDFAVWLISFGATAFVNVTIGLGISLGFILLTVVMQEQFPKTFELGTDGERRYFKPVDVYTSLKKVSANVTIFKFESPLHFANCATFSEKVTELFAEVGMEMTGTKIGDKNMELKESLLTPFNHYFILDCAAITYIDSMGLDTLRKLYDESKLNKVCFILADVTETVLTLYEKCQDGNQKGHIEIPVVRKRSSVRFNFGDGPEDDEESVESSSFRKNKDDRDQNDEDADCEDIEDEENEDDDEDEDEEENEEEEDVFNFKKISIANEPIIEEDDFYCETPGQEAIQKLNFLKPILSTLKEPVTVRRKSIEFLSSALLGPTMNLTMERRASTGDLYSRRKSISINPDLVKHRELLNKRPSVFQHMAKIHKKLGIKHYILVLTLALYALLGGLIFLLIESDNEIQTLQENRDTIYTMMNKLALTTMSISQNSTFTKEQKREYLVLLIRKTYKQMLQVESKYTGSVLHKYERVDMRLTWYFSSSVFYACTVFTSIGFGTIACSTAFGKAATLIYASVGIPLMLVVLGDVGEVLLRWFIMAYNWIYLKVSKYWNKLSRKFLKSKYEIEEEERQQLPFLISFLIIISYLLLVSVIIYLADYHDAHTDSLSLFDSFYFSFVAIATIGFGDVVPNQIQYSPILPLLFLIGLALLSVVNSTLYESWSHKFLFAVEKFEFYLENISIDWKLLFTFRRTREHPIGWETFRCLARNIELLTVSIPLFDDDTEEQISQILDKKERKRKHKKVKFISKLRARGSTLDGKPRPILGIMGGAIVPSFVSESDTEFENRVTSKDSFKDSKNSLSKMGISRGALVPSFISESSKRSRSATDGSIDKMSFFRAGDHMEPIKEVVDDINDKPRSLSLSDSIGEVMQKSDKRDSVASWRNTLVIPCIMIEEAEEECQNECPEIVIEIPSDEEGCT